MWYAVDGLPKGANAAAFCPPPPPVVTDAADSSMGLVTSTVTLERAQLTPAPASVAGDFFPSYPTRQVAVGADPGWETGVMERMVYIGRPAVGFGELVPTRPNEMIPVPAQTPNAVQSATTVENRRPRFLGKGQVSWPRAFQRWPGVAGS